MAARAHVEAQLISQRDTATVLSVSETTVKRMVADRQLASTLVRGRRLVFRDSVDEYLERNRVDSQ